MDNKQIDVTHISPDVDETGTQKDKNIIKIEFSDVLKISSGIDSGGNPLAAGILAKDRVFSDKKEPQTLDNIFLENAVYDITADAGTAVIKMEFPSQSTVYYQKALNLCKEWISARDEYPADEVLSLLISPYLLNGCIHVLFQHLVFADGYHTEDGTKCLLLVFDHTSTMVYETEDIDYGLIVRQVEAEIKRQEDELYDDMEKAKSEERESQNRNPYHFGNSVPEMYQPENIEDRKEETIHKRNIRSGKRYKGIRIVKEDDDEE